MVVNLYKQMGETPRERLERLRQQRPYYEHEVLSYAGRLDPMAEGVLLCLVLWLAALAGSLRWEAHHDRLMVGREPVSAYRLETRVLDHPIVIYISTLGEILRVELPGGTTAVLDQLGGS